MALSKPFGKSDGTLRASTTFGSPGPRAFFALFARVKDLSAMATACWEMDNASLSSSASAVAAALFAFEAELEVVHRLVELSRRLTRERSIVVGFSKPRG